MTRRLLLSYLGLALLVLAGLEIPLGYIYARGEESRFAQTVERDATMLAEVTEENIEKGNLAELPILIGDYTARTGGGRVVVVDRTGIVLAASGTVVSTGTNLSAQPDIATALRNQPTTGTFTDANGDRALYATLPGSSGTTVRGALRLTYPMTMVTDRVHRIWLALALVGACVLAAVALVAVTLARWITRPLRTLERATHQLADGRMTNPPDADSGPPELRSLAASFTRTATRLQHLLKAQHAFAAEASHQLKTPLTALRLRLENFEPYLDPRAHGSLEATIEEVERLVVLLYPLVRERLRTPLLRMPEDPVPYLFAILRTTPPDDTESVRRLLAANRSAYDLVRAGGGTQYPVGSVPFDRADWRRHFGSAWPRFAAARKTYDPRGNLVPGQGIF
ncbi:HAMP domain-containing protein [Streptomyces sp. GTA36]